MVFIFTLLSVFFFSLIPSCALCYGLYQIKYEADNLGIEVLKWIQLTDLLLIIMLVCNLIWFITIWNRAVNVLNYVFQKTVFSSVP